MNWLDTSVAPALARALVSFLWEGAAIAALLAVMLVVLRRAPAQARYAAACAAMAAMIGSFIVTAAAPGPAAWQPGPRVAAALPAPPPGPGVPRRDPAPAPPATWAVALWLAGVAVLMVRRTGGWLAARRMLKRAAVAADHRAAALLERLRARTGVARAVALVESGLAQAPCVVGWLRPAILMPAGLVTGLGPEQVEAILLHELAHVRRHDYLVNLLQGAVEDLLFYHPAVWWVGSVMRRERENCCDDAVVAMGGDRRTWARTLATMEAMRAAEPALAATGAGLADRIRRLLGAPEGPRASAVPLVAAMALVCLGAAALPAWQTRAASPEPAQAQAQPAPRPAAQASPQEREERQSKLRNVIETPYRKWLNEDVAYIIDDRERAAFQQLQTDEEREHFIEQFWLRRDPTPGTVENEFKEEHYRRIAYANEKFAGDVPGWKTDRGRIYIVYGPPDEKESHPAGQAGGPPYEEWLYRKIEGIGERVIIRFEDTQRDGHYRMTRDPAVPARPGGRGGPGGQPAGHVPEPAAALGAAQANGDLLYASGDASVRVGAGGATLITVAAGEVWVTVRRMASGGGSAQTVLEESARVPGIGYTKLLTLPRGSYRLEVERRGAPAEHDEQLAMANLQAQLANVRAEWNAARTTYTDNHPRVRELETQLALLRSQTAIEERRISAGPLTARVDFRVP